MGFFFFLLILGGIFAGPELCDMAICRIRYNHRARTGYTASKGCIKRDGFKL